MDTIMEDKTSQWGTRLLVEDFRESEALKPSAFPRFIYKGLLKSSGQGINASLMTSKAPPKENCGKYSFPYTTFFSLYFTGYLDQGALAGSHLCLATTNSYQKDHSLQPCPWSINPLFTIPSPINTHSALPPSKP